MKAVKYLERIGKPSLAYVKLEGKRKPGVVYLSGLMSSMNSPKALAVEQMCSESGQPFLRFDYSGTYASSSVGYVCNIKDWVEDGIEMFTKLTSGPQVIVGSSMGAFIMLHLAKRFPEKVVGMVGVSGAFHFIRTA
ncbi:palmitoyl-protein thioesterase ABHD10, mitochondrial-like [Ciona intestinalis]